MNKYYDIKCVDCFGCAYCQTGEYPNGKPYEACRNYGYILHPERGISEAHCEGKCTQEQYKRLMEAQAKRDEERLQKKKRK